MITALAIFAVIGVGIGLWGEFSELQPFERSELRMKTAMGNSTHDAKKLLSLSVSPASRATATAQRRLSDMARQYRERRQ